MMGDPKRATFAAPIAGVDLRARGPPPSRYAWQRPPPATAGVGRRAAAFAIDAIVVLLATWIVTAAAASAGLLRIPDAEIAGVRNDATGLLWLVSLLEMPVLLLYHTALEAATGRTPGKLLLGLRVRAADGGRATLSDTFLRNLLRLLWVTPLGPAFIVLDWWALQSTELDQRLGDLAADAVVVDERTG
ncbi:MAG TPA: RDD family protein [Candidatus Thermoplasmatota archaeon]|nr:RDD family protein [Candidatus Thermoplasmatota archaeon]